jgi:hypothetical protein
VTTSTFSTVFESYRTLADSGGDLFVGDFIVGRVALVDLPRGLRGRAVVQLAAAFLAANH